VHAPPADPDWVPLADLPRLEQALDRAQRAYGSRRHLPIYVTEYGIETNPPRPDFFTTPALQASYLNQAEYMTWRDPRVRVMTQYLLKDAPPGGGSRVSSFASGLMFFNGRRKPAFAAYRLPLWLPSLRSAHGGTLEVWGCLRPAKRFPGQTLAPVEIQFDGHTVRTIRPSDPRGYFVARVKFPHTGSVRLAWRAPGGSTTYSRSVEIVEGGGGIGAAPLAIAAGALLALVAYTVLRRFARVRERV
jgi:hypothetical protein